MRRVTVRSAVLAACLALAAACTGEHSMTIGPPHSTAPSAGSEATEAVEADAAETEPADATGTAPAVTGAADKGAGAAGPTATTSRLPASIRPGADIPASVMLRPTDFPAGVIRAERTDVAALPQTEPSACQPLTAYPSDRYRYGARTRRIESDQPEPAYADEVAVRYSAGRAAQAMAEMRRVLAACRSYPDPETPGAVVSYRLERQRFAGDDALLVLRTHRPPTGQTGSEYITVIRLGDVLLTTTSAGSEATASLSLALRLADVGARRGACLRSTC